MPNIALVDCDFLSKVCPAETGADVLSKILKELDFVPCLHPYTAKYEIISSGMKKLSDSVIFGRLSYDEILSGNDECDEELYCSLFFQLHDDLRNRLDVLGGSKQLEPLRVPKGRSLFDYHKAKMSLGDVHLILTAYFMGVPIILSNDTDMEILKSIITDKNKDSFSAEIYSIMDLIEIILKRADSSISEKELKDFAKQIGERKKWREIKAKFGN